MTNSRTTVDGQGIRRDTRAALAYALVALALGIVILVVYASATGGVSWVGLQLLVMAAAVAGGTLLGFLFGIPRMLQAPENPPPAAEGEQAKRTRKLLNYQSNTNLEQISDWLTKILVGVGLTQLHEVGDALQRITGYLVRGHSASGAAGATTASILYFTATGFFLGYLWTRLVYARLLVSTESSILQDLEEVEAERDTLAAERDTLAKIAVSAAKRDTGLVTADDAAVARSAASVAEVPAGMDAALPPVTVEDDPNKGRFGGAAARNGLKLTARVQELATDPDWFTVILEVRSGRRKLEGPVVFYLHPTFSQPVETVEPVNNTARLELLAYGAFTVGVLADGGKTKLELDLAELPNAPQRFRER